MKWKLIRKPFSDDPPPEKPPGTPAPEGGQGQGG